MSKQGRGRQKRCRTLALDIGNSWREVARNCHVDPEGHNGKSGDDDE